MVRYIETLEVLMRHPSHKESKASDRNERRLARSFDGEFARGRARHATRRRILDHGDLRYLLLHLIAEKPHHGYELIKAIEETFGGMYSPSPGVIYPTLSMLEELGHIVPQAVDGTKKAYAATEAGKAFLAGNRPAVDRVLARMATAAQAFGGGPGPGNFPGQHNVSLA